MEYFELIKTAEFDIVVEGNTKFMRIELLRSNENKKLYRAKIMEMTDYNLYPSMFNTGPNGEDQHHFHSADRIWKEIPVSELELHMGYVSDTENFALETAITELYKVYKG